MEPVTHILTGACLARAGFNRKAAYATLTMAIGAELPDIDTVWSLRGPVEGFTHHRGITHTLVGLPVEAALLVGAVYGWHRFRLAREERRFAAGVPKEDREEGGIPTARTARAVKPLTAAPVRWGVLYGLALMALLSHLLLDYTNNYGLRPFYPFDARWYAGSFVFIFDPAIFLCLLAALVGPALFGLIGAEVGARRQVFRGRGWAVTALCAVVAMWTLRAVEHGRAVNLAMAQNIALPDRAAATDPGMEENTDLPATSQAGSAPVGSGGSPTTLSQSMPVYLEAQRVLASPDPVNPFHWSTATDFGPLYQLAEVDTRSMAFVEEQRTFYKVEGSAALAAAEKSPLGRAYLDWSPMPVLDIDRNEDGSSDVTFRDPRFMGGYMRDLGSVALRGEVSVDARGEVLRQAMDGRVER